MRKFYFILWTLVIIICAAAPCFAADYNVSLDVGPNITGLVQQLAHHLGMTADKLFPMYVQKASMEGWTFICVFISFLLIGVLLVALCYRKADFNAGNLQAWLVGLGMLLTVITLFVAAFCISDAIQHVMSPQYYAIHDLTNDMAKLIPRRQ